MLLAIKQIIPHDILELSAILIDGCVNQGGEIMREFVGWLRDSICRILTNATGLGERLWPR